MCTHPNLTKGRLFEKRGNIKILHKKGRLKKDPPTKFQEYICPECGYKRIERVGSQSPQAGTVVVN